MVDIVKLPNREPSAKSAFCRTGCLRDIYSVAERCQRAHAMGLIMGPSGTGKSAAAKAFVSETHHAFLVTVPGGELEPFPLLTRIAACLGAYNPNTGLMPLYEGLADFLCGPEGHGGVLILDEFQHATYKAIEILRSLHQDTAFPMVFMGDCRLHRFWAEKAGRGGEDYAPFRGRLRYVLDLPASLDDDIEALLDHLSIRGQRPRTLLRKQAATEEGLHAMFQVAAIAGDLAEGGSIGVDHIEAALALRGTPATMLGLTP